MDLGLTGRVAAVLGPDGPSSAACVALLAAEGATAVAGGLGAPAARAALSAHGRVDVVVALLPPADLTPVEDFADLEHLTAAWASVVAVVEAYQVALPGMVQRGFGRFIAVLPTGVKAVSADGGDLEVLTALGVLGLHKVAGHENGPSGVTANAVLVGGPVSHEDVAGAVAWLASDLAAYLNGTTLAVDAGTTVSVF